MNYMRWYACSFPIYLNPKSSTTNENMTGCYLCFQIPGVCIHVVLGSLQGNNFLFSRHMVGRTLIYLSLHICIHCVPPPLVHIVLWFLLGLISVIIGCINICTLVSLCRSFYFHILVTIQPLWICCHWKGIWCCDVWCYCTEIAYKTDEVSLYHNYFPVRFFLLGSVIANNLAIGDVRSPICWYFSRARKNTVLVPFNMYPTPCARHPIFVFIVFY